MKTIDLNVYDRNPVAILNEFRNNLVYDVVEQKGPPHAPIFKVCVNVDGHKYVGVGKSKKIAKCNAAQEALRSFIQFPCNYKVVNNNKKSNDSKIDFTTDVFDMEKNDSEMEDTNCARKVTKGPVMLLNELYPSTKYECKEFEGNVIGRFQITIYLEGETFVGTGKLFNLSFTMIIYKFIIIVGSSKKLAKSAAATAALSKIFSLKSGVTNGIISNYRISVVSKVQQEIANEIGRYDFYYYTIGWYTMQIYFITIA